MKFGWKCTHCEKMIVFYYCLLQPYLRIVTNCGVATMYRITLTHTTKYICEIALVPGVASLNVSQCLLNLTENEFELFLHLNTGDGINADFTT